MALDGQKWPDWLWIVRHGQSESNVARRLAEEAAREHIGIEIRDVDVALSAQGREQALAVGRWFGAMPPDERPNLVLVSPYRRAIQTAQAICEAAGIEVSRADGSYVVDERLREKEFGVLTGLTRAGIASLHPNEYELRMLFGKFYHRPPGGESYCDVIMRLRSVLGHHHPRARGRRPGADRLPLGRGQLLPLPAGADDRRGDHGGGSGQRGAELLDHQLPLRSRGGRRGHGGLVREQCNDVRPLIQAGVGIS